MLVPARCRGRQCTAVWSASPQSFRISTDWSSEMMYLARGFGRQFSPSLERRAGRGVAYPCSRSTSDVRDPLILRRHGFGLFLPRPSRRKSSGIHDQSMRLHAFVGFACTKCERSSRFT